MERSLKTVHVRYFAVLRDRRGLVSETVDTQAGDLQELYRELSQRYALGLGPELVRFAVDGEIVSPATPLTDGLHVAFLPPVAGG